MEHFDRDGKINFVDTNDAFVGYDMYQDCCEQADWCIVQSPSEFAEINLCDTIPHPADLDGWVFDPAYFRSVENMDLDSGAAVMFRMTLEGAEQFLVLFNSHNGYYGHGFTAKIGGIERSDIL